MLGFRFKSPAMGYPYYIYIHTAAVVVVVMACFGPWYLLLLWFGIGFRLVGGKDGWMEFVCRPSVGSCFAIVYRQDCHGSFM